MKGLVLFVCAAQVLAVVGVAATALAVESQARTKLILEGKYDEIIRLREAELREQPTRPAVADLADEWVRFHSLDKAAAYYGRRETKDLFDVLVLAEINGRLGRLDHVPLPPYGATEAIQVALNGVYFDYALYDRIDWSVPLGDECMNGSLMLHLERTNRVGLAARILENHLVLSREEASDGQPTAQRDARWEMGDDPVRLYVLLHQRALRLDELLARYETALASGRADPALYYEYKQVLGMLGMKPEAGAFVPHVDEAALEGVLAAIELRRAEGNSGQVARLCTKALDMPITKEARARWTWGWSAMFPPDEIDRRLQAGVRKWLAEANVAEGELDKAKAIYISFLDKEWPVMCITGLRGLEAIAQIEHEETFKLQPLIEKLGADPDPMQTEVATAELYRLLDDVPRYVEHERRAIDLMLETAPGDERGSSALSRVHNLAVVMRRSKMDEERSRFLHAVLDRATARAAESNRAGLLQLYAEVGRYSAALDVLFSMIGDGKCRIVTLRYYLDSGYRVARTGHMTEGFFRRLEEIIPKYPDTAEFNRLWAETYARHCVQFDRGWMNISYRDVPFRRALEFYKRIGPDLEPGDYYQMACVHEITKDFADAARCQEKAVLAECPLQNGYFRLADFYSKSGQNQKAVDTYAKMIELASGLDKLPSIPGWARRAKLDGALIERLEAMVERKQTTWKHHLVLAKLYGERNENAEAIANYRAACDLNPNAADVLFWCARFLDMQGMGRSAVPLYERCFVLPLDRADVGPRLLDLYVEEQRVEEALSLAERVLAEWPERNERIYARYAELAEEHDQLARAKGFLERLVHNYPNEALPKQWSDKLTDKTEP